MDNGFKETKELSELDHKILQYLQGKTLVGHTIVGYKVVERKKFGPTEPRALFSIMVKKEDSGEIKHYDFNYKKLQKQVKE